jgi:hypothetical protein
VKGYKVFNPDWTCRGFEYEVGKTYKHNGKISLCGAGFHFCLKAVDCFNYYSFDSNNKVALVESNGKSIKCENDSKVCVDEITIIKEIAWPEVLEICNTGVGNTGNRNSGSWNSGNWNSGNSNNGNRNSGNSNSGHSNSGHSNSGHSNSGHRNSGHSNSGHSNSGHRNSGDRNSGDCNRGDWNSGNSNSGIFNTNEPKLRMFNKESEWSFSDWYNSEQYGILLKYFVLNNWVYEENMTETEKKDNPGFYVAGGYLKTYGYKEACKNMWDKLTDKEKDKIKELPNFDKEIFKEITGIEI